MAVAIPEFGTMVATAGLEDVQIAAEVSFPLPPLLRVPVAVNCCCSPSGRDELAGVTETNDTTAGAAVRTEQDEADPQAGGSAAQMFVEPLDPTTVARPCVGDTLLIVATEVLEDVHDARLVTFWVLPSL